jgi:hypothetical protein
MGEHERSVWMGWIWFGGTIMIILGLFTAIEGLIALFKDEYYIISSNGLLVFTMTAWGWIYLIFGICAVAAGIALFTGAAWARMVTVLIVSLNALSQLAFLSANPIWATIVIAMDVLVLWAVVVHGGVAQEAGRRTGDRG